MADTKSCVEKRPMTEFPLTAMTCMSTAQPMASDYLREHPAYQLASFRCEVDRPVEKQA